MEIIIDNGSMVPIYEQIVEQIKKQIIKGDLVENDRLESVRSLSKMLGISALTVKKAYDQLETEGFIQTVHGKGSFVSGANMDLMKEEQVKEIEDEIFLTIKKARAYKLTDEEISSIFNIILEE